MKRIYVAAVLAIVFLLTAIPSFADSETFFFDVIAKETLNIQQISAHDYKSLSDAYSSRGESYLVLNDDQHAIDDFLIAYEYALRAEKRDQDILSLRALFGAFLVYVRLEDLQNVQTLFDILSPLIDSYPCCGCKGDSTNNLVVLASSQQQEKDYPIFGPDRVTIKECMDRVDAVTEQLELLIAAVKQSTVRVLAAALIDQLSTGARQCCRSGGLWKGCLQKLVNKFHYWNKLGIPTDHSYYTGIHFMSSRSSQSKDPQILKLKLCN